MNECARRRCPWPRALLVPRLRRQRLRYIRNLGLSLQLLLLPRLSSMEAQARLTVRDEQTAPKWRIELSRLVTLREPPDAQSWVFPALWCAITVAGSMS